MQKRLIAQTGIEVSVIGLGTVKFGRNQGVKYPHAFELPHDDEIKTLLTLAKESGVNLLDTAPAYGESEARLGKLLQNRKDWILSTKVGETFVDGKSLFNFSAPAIMQSVESSLKKLRTDYIDILFIHSHGEDEHLVNNEKVFHTLEKLKQNGKIRAFGMSSKTLSGGLLTIDKADVAMVTYNTLHTEEKAVIDYAEQKQKGIFIKKALASGHLAKDKKNALQENMQFIFSASGVSSVIMGTINPLHLQEIINCTTKIFNAKST